MVITTEQLQAEYEQLAANVAKAPGDGMTTREIMDATGWSITKTRKFIALGVRVGRVKATRKQQTTISDGVTTVPAYVIGTETKRK